jgi:hypothetical protein
MIFSHDIKEVSLNLVSRKCCWEVYAPSIFIWVFSL